MIPRYRPERRALGDLRPTSAAASAAAGWASRTVRPAGPALPARGAAPGAGTTAVGDGSPGCLHPGTGLATDLAGGGRVGQGRTVTTTVARGTTPGTSPDRKSTRLNSSHVAI